MELRCNICGIFASFNRDKLKTLYELNSYRGSKAFSICEFWQASDSAYLPSVIPANLFSGEGVLPLSLLDESFKKPNAYVVGHVQAPTTESGGRHPAAAGGRLLWHNGIVKQKTIKKNEWDTLTILQKIGMPPDFKFEKLSTIDGTFACVMYGADRIMFFRNEISPLFIDEEMSVSSVKFDGGNELPPNTVFALDFATKKLHEVAKFKTKTNPYFFGIE